ncbi:7643_t:CDS:2 [Scutellospora calospora]|uniref:7643_t:CDS:1 n=1 Tax=Scutellospora calospora TaxID=85575 RepID=A0ACA9KT25_9GLOM|nr:7643_t:CDS:2 [Scutellospora calospora]
MTNENKITMTVKGDVGVKRKKYVNREVAEDMLGGTFSYINGKTYIITIDNNTKMRISSLNTDIARVYFFNNNNVQVPVPNGMVMHDDVNNYNLRHFRGEYHISWIYSYTLFWNGNVVVRLYNQKQQAVDRGVGFEDYEVE